jgi:hypothetical protein
MKATVAPPSGAKVGAKSLLPEVNCAKVEEDEELTYRLVVFVFEVSFYKEGRK